MKYVFKILIKSFGSSDLQFQHKTWYLTSRNQCCDVQNGHKRILESSLTIWFDSGSTDNSKIIPILALVGNDVIMTLSWCNKMGLLLNSQKKSYVGQHFWFCHIWVMWRRSVEHVTADFAYFIFYFCNSFKFTISNKNILTTTHDNHSSLIVLWGGAKKISHHSHDDNGHSQPLQQ